MTRSSECSGEFTSTVCGVNYSWLFAMMLLKQPNEQLQVAVDHSQQRKMVSKTRSNWLAAPHPLQGSTPTLSCTVQMLATNHYV